MTLSNSREYILDFFLYIIEEPDIETFLNYSNYKPKSDFNRKLFTKKKIPKGFSNPQKMLLIYYACLYYCLKEINIETNRDLDDVLKLFSLKKEIKAYIFKHFNQLDKEKITCGKEIIICILDPNQYVSLNAEKVINNAFQDNRFIIRKVINNLKSIEYEHKLDKKTLQNLRNTPGLDILVRKFNQYGLEKLFKVQYTGSNIKVTKNNFPYIYRALKEACQILSVKKIPDLYISLGFINAWTMGVENPIIVITSGCASLLSYDELLFILGHELGHIKSEHVLYHQMASVLPILGQFLGSMTLGLGGLISTGLEIALLNWQRKSEFTADRAGLLTCQNVDAATTAMMKIAGAPPQFYRNLKTEDFEKQAKEFIDMDINPSDKIAKVISVRYADHPWTVMRGHELYNWVELGEYYRVLNRKSDYTLSKRNIYCTNCGKEFKSNEKFCTHCGNIR